MSAKIETLATKYVNAKTDKTKSKYSLIALSMSKEAFLQFESLVHELEVKKNKLYFVGSSDSMVR